MGFPALFSRERFPLLIAAAVSAGLFLSGCDERVDVVRDHNVHIQKHATWAWRPATPEAEGERRDHDKDADRDRDRDHDRDRRDDDRRPVVSRDVIDENGRAETVSRDYGVDNETLRLAIRTDIQQTLSKKGFKQVDDPAAADFLVDYHIGIRRHTVRVERYPGGYPGFVCGPFGCYASYRWGYWGGPGYRYENVNYREGTIVFDFVKQGSNKIAFRAVGQKQLNRDSFSTNHVRDAVERLLRDLKPGK
jgi:hypothetical protein